MESNYRKVTWSSDGRGGTMAKQFSLKMAKALSTFLEDMRSSEIRTGWSSE